MKLVINVFNGGRHQKRRRHLRCVGVEDIQRERGCSMFKFGNKFYDKLSGVLLTVAADGATDKPPKWDHEAVDANGDEVLGVTLEAAEDGLSCKALIPMLPIASLTVTATAEVDDENTPGTETIQEVFQGSFSHSKAKTLTGSVSDIPRD